MFELIRSHRLAGAASLAIMQIKRRDAGPSGFPVAHILAKNTMRVPSRRTKRFPALAG